MMSENSDSSIGNPGPKQERSRRTYERLLVAAERLFVESGWDSLTTNAIAEAAGISIGSLYRYFPDKAAVVRALAERAAAPALARMDELLTLPALDGDSVVASFLSAGEVELPEGSLCLARLQGPRCSDELGEIAAAVETAMEERLARIIARLLPGIEPGTALVKAKLIRGAVTAASAESYRDPSLASALRDELVALIVAYLGGPAEPERARLDPAPGGEG